MHNAQAELRAIESGRYVARAANTGISTVITHRGEVVGKLAPLTDGVLIEDVHLRKTATPYTVIGNLFIYLWLAALVAILGVEGVFAVQKRIFSRKSLDKNESK